MGSFPEKVSCVLTNEEKLFGVGKVRRDFAGRRGRRRGSEGQRAVSAEKPVHFLGPGT